MSSVSVQQKRQAIGKTFQQCPLCSSPHLGYEFVVDKSPVCGCEECGLLFLNPQPQGVPEPSREPNVESTKPLSIYETNASERLQELLEYSGIRSGTLLVVGADDALKTEAKSSGFELFTMSAEQIESEPLE